MGGERDGERLLAEVLRIALDRARRERLLAHRGGELVVGEDRARKPRRLSAQCDVREARSQGSCELVWLVFVYVMRISGGVDAAIGGRNAHNSTRAHHSGELVEHRISIVYVLDDLEAHDEIELAVGERKRANVPLQDFDVCARV